MKKFLLLGLIVSCFSCTKSVTDTLTPNNTPGLITKTNTATDSTYFTRDLGGTVLTINMNAVVHCYAAGRGEVAKPCDIFTDIVCHLSNPINAFVKVEIEKRDMKEQNRTASIEAGTQRIVVVIAPNTTKITFPSSFTNKNNYDVPDSQYKIVGTLVYQTSN